MSKHVHIRAREGTRRKLKLLSVVMQMSMSDLLEKLVNEEGRKQNVNIVGDPFREDDL